MAGMIVVSPGKSWSAASWLFLWVLRTLAEESSSPELTPVLHAIEVTNVNYLALPDLPAETRGELGHLIRERLPMRARYQLAAVLSEPGQPVHMDVPAVFAKVQQLADLVGRPSL
jgi:hypothetical protein